MIADTTGTTIATTLNPANRNIPQTEGT